MSTTFNVYYINYAKAFEIAMQMDNRILEQTIKDYGWELGAEGQASIDDKEVKNPIISKLLPKLNASLSISGSKSSRASDTIKVVSTKSTVLAPIVKKASEVKKIDDSKIGNLIKIKNVNLTVHNGSDILAAKALMSGLLSQIPVEGVGQMDLTGLADAFLKGASYILTGVIPDRVKTDSANAQILLKIPMQMDNEMESQYSIADIEIGPVTVVGIYRGKYNAGTIRKRVDTLSSFSKKNEISEMETADEVDASGFDSEAKMHYIDVIAVIQELSF